ncbi:hypothetical protein [Neobacillus drentensis]|uniref:hypothetical protein n=1 Tax=Neobacillus drentensis TaxID=220684 RepID=UPI0028564798|nr:hypothetical protein [Neobacillus drentensis]MDR7239373.1 hypothetical protein [Neobacillus drentensis]
MNMDWKKRLLYGGLAVSLTFGGLAGCGDGVDQDNGISDGEQKDAIDTDKKQEANGTMQDAEENIKDAVNNVEKKLEDNGVGDGVDQDNGITDGEKKDELDN